MTQTVAEFKASQKSPAACELFPIRDFPEGDNVMVRTDGCYVAGYRVTGARTYFSHDEKRDEVSETIDALLRTIPEESMRVQFRYEVSENTGGLIDRYADFSRTDDPNILQLDAERIEIWREREKRGDFISRRVQIYFIWDPVKHRRLHASLKAEQRCFFSVGLKQNIEIERSKHEKNLDQFGTLLNGAESSMRDAGLNPERMSGDDIATEIVRCFVPEMKDPIRIQHRAIEDRYVSPREQLTRFSIQDFREDHAIINNYIWAVVTLKAPPDSTHSGILRNMMTLGFPCVISTNVLVGNQDEAKERYKKRMKRMISAQSDYRGRPRVDVAAQVAVNELMDIQSRIMGSTTKTCHVSVTVAVRTSKQFRSDAERDIALKEIMARREQVMHLFAQTDGAAGLAETYALQHKLVGSLPGLAYEDQRGKDLLSCHAANLVPIEMPWQGTESSPLFLVPTPYGQLIPISPFDPKLENHNGIICATSGSGKSVLVGLFLLSCARRNLQVSIIERGDSYLPVVQYMGGDMLTVSLDAEFAINPFDLDPGEVEPSEEHKSFLKNLVTFMIGDGGDYDKDLLDAILGVCLKNIYDRARHREEGNRIPIMSDLYDELDTYRDKNSHRQMEELAGIAALKMRNWCGDGIYAKLFDSPTVVNMHNKWLYFNIEKLKDDQRLERAMSLVIANATTRRAIGKPGTQSLTIFDECWALLDSPSLSLAVEQMYRTARKRNAGVFGVSQAVEDFTGTPNDPKKIGAAILATTAIRLVGRQKANVETLRRYLHFTDACIEAVRTMRVTEKGKRSMWLATLSEDPESTSTIYVELTPTEKWLTTTYPRDKSYREYYKRLHPEKSIYEVVCDLGKKFPDCLSAVPELPEERSGEVVRVISQPLNKTANGMAMADDANTDGNIPFIPLNTNGVEGAMHA